MGGQTSGQISLFGMKVQILAWVLHTLVLFFCQVVIRWADGSTLHLLRLLRVVFAKLLAFLEAFDLAENEYFSTHTFN